MAAGQHKLSRRALLGAVCAVPVFSRHPGLDPGSTFSSPAPQGRRIPDQVRDDGGGAQSSAVTIWDRAFARLQKAQAALDAAAHTPDEDLYDRLGARHTRALTRLLRTPAPDLPALAAKLDLALDQRSGEFFGDEADMKAIKSDARRLASQEGAAAYDFQPPSPPRPVEWVRTKPTKPVLSDAVGSVEGAQRVHIDACAAGNSHPSVEADWLE